MMLTALGWVCLVIGVAMLIALITTSQTKLDDNAYRTRRMMGWVANPLWFIAVAMCWR